VQGRWPTAWSPAVDPRARTIKSLWLALASIFSVNLSFVAGAAWGKGQAVAMVSVFTVITGYADSRGFVHAARVWSEGQVVWRELALSGLGFLVGVVAYWIVVRYASQLGVQSAVLQTMGWFAVTIFAVALTDIGNVRWQLLDTATAGVVVAGLGLLLYRTGA
jgi:hypothetical protein